MLRARAEVLEELGVAGGEVVGESSMASSLSKPKYDEILD